MLDRLLRDASPPWQPPGRKRLMPIMSVQGRFNIKLWKRLQDVFNRNPNPNF